MRTGGSAPVACTLPPRPGANCGLLEPGQPNTRTTRTAAPAFTLLELLCVMGVIALLAAVLLPVLAQSRHSARRVACANNLRQLGLATQMYWDDHEGRAFVYRGAYTNGGDVYWFGWLQRWDGHNEGRRAFDVTQGALYPYLQGRGVEVCPAFDYGWRLFKPKATGASYGYGYNRELSGRQVATLTRPAELIVLADAAQVNDFQPPASPEQPMLEEFYYVSALEPKPTAHFRHRHWANALFADMHVATERPVPGSLDPALPQAWVGKLRPEALQVP